MTAIKPYRIDDIKQCLEYIEAMLNYLKIPLECVSYETGRSPIGGRIVCQVSLREATVMVIRYDGYQNTLFLIIT